MNVFVAGGSGTLGVPLVRALVAAGHRVTALTRSPSKRDSLRALGAGVAVADALDPDALTSAVVAARPTHVIHQLTALPKGGPRRASDLEATNRLRIDGTRHLIAGSVQAGARRIVVGSFAPLADYGQDDFPASAAAEAIRSMERQVLEANRGGSIEGVVLRYGLFYGGEAPSTTAMASMVRRRRLPVIRGDRSRLPVVHVDDAVAATVLALDRAPAGSTYDIVDDRPSSLAEIVEGIAEATGSPAPRRVPAWLPRLVAPYLSRMTSIRLSPSNAAAKADLGWRPRYPTMREGLAAIFRG